MKKVLVLGLGSSGQRFVRILRNSYGDNIQIYVYRRGKRNVLISPDLQSSQERDPSEFFGLIEVQSINELDGHFLDLIIISSVTSAHFQDMQLINVLKYKALLVEKPLLMPENVAESSATARSLMEKHLCISGYFSRMHPLALKLRAIIRSSELGRPIFYQSWFGEKVSEMHPYEDHTLSYTSSDKLGGGPLNTFSHDLDLMLFLFDRLSDLTFHSYKNDWVEIDTCEIEYLTSRGEVAGNRFLVQSSFDFVSWPKTRGGKMVFEDGSVTWNWQTLILEVLSLNSGLQVFDFSEIGFEEIIRDCLLSLLLGQSDPEYLMKNWADFVQVGVILSQRDIQI